MEQGEASQLSAMEQASMSHGDLIYNIPSSTHHGSQSASQPLPSANKILENHASGPVPVSTGKEVISAVNAVNSMNELQRKLQARMKDAVGDSDDLMSCSSD